MNDWFNKYAARSDQYSQDSNDELDEMSFNMPKEVFETFRELSDMIIPVLMDGWRKRSAGTKPHWKEDEHYKSMMRHIYRYRKGELVDKDSGCHPLVHTAVRALMIAGQESEKNDSPQSET